MKAHEHRRCRVRRHSQPDDQTDLGRRETRAREVKRDDDPDSANGGGAKRSGETDQRRVTRQRVNLRRAHCCGVHNYP